MANINKSTKWRLVVSDLDGTLLNENSELSPENVKAAASLARQGIGLTLATGRIDTMAQVFAQQLSISLPIISSNGALIKDRSSGKVIRRHLLPAKAASQILNWLARREVPHLAYAEDVAYYPEKIGYSSHYKDYNRLAEQVKAPPIILQPIQDAVLSGRMPLMKIMAKIPQAKLQKEFQAYCATQAGCESVRSAPTGFDIMAAGISKGAALRDLAEYLDIDLQQVVAIGDQDNDISMLQVAGLGIAMENASHTAKEASQLLAGHHQEHGFARAIKQHVLTDF